MKSRLKNLRPTLEALEDRVVPYALEGSQWSNVNVSVSFMPDGTMGPQNLATNLFATLNKVAPTATWQREFARALQTWANVTPLNFHFVSDSGAASAIAGSAQGDSRFGDTRLGGYDNSTWLGLGFEPGTPSTLGGDAFLSTTSTFTWDIGFMDPTHYDIYSTALHEIGHSIGMDHSSLQYVGNVPVVMYPALTQIVTGLSSDDIAGAQAMYGPRMPDAYDAAASNNTIASATALALDGSGALSISADLTTMADVDNYRVTAPTGSNGTLTVSVDARNLSLLDPKVSVYGAAGNLLGTTSATTYGSVATLTLTGLTGGQTYYLQADGATTDVFGMGAYNLQAQFSGFSGTAPPPSPSLSINNVSQLEGNSGTSLFTFTVSLSAASTNTVTVQYASADGTATAGSDYVATNGTVTFAPGVTQQTVSVIVNGDTTVEADETFFVNLSSPVNATLAVGQGRGTIQNDDTAPPPAQPSVSINNVSQLEGNSGTSLFTFTVSLSAPSTNTVTVNYASADGTATAGSDYAAASGTLTFAPGQTQQTIAVSVNGDTVYEPDETFSVNLSNPSNATLGISQGLGTIQNDDLAPDRYEFDDTAAAAAGFGNVSGVNQSSLTLNTPTDLDYYSFSPSKSGTYNVTITPSQGSGTLNLSVLTSSLGAFGSWQANAGADSVSLSLSAGQRYYVEAYSSTGNLFTYGLNVAKLAGGKHQIFALAETNANSQETAGPGKSTPTNSSIRMPVSVTAFVSPVLEQAGIVNGSSVKQGAVVTNQSARPALFVPNLYRDLLLINSEADDSNSLPQRFQSSSSSAQAAHDVYVSLEHPASQVNDVPTPRAPGKADRDMRTFLFDSNYGDSGTDDMCLGSETVDVDTDAGAQE